MEQLGADYRLLIVALLLPPVHGISVKGQDLLSLRLNPRDLSQRSEKELLNHLPLHHRLPMIHSYQSFDRRAPRPLPAILLPCLCLGFSLKVAPDQL